MIKLRSQTLSRLILQQTKAILDRLFFPDEIRQHIIQIDIFDNDSLFYLEKLDAFQLLETNIMDRVLQEYWKSDFDADGSFFSASTAYNIIKRAGPKFPYDYESDNRFYHYKDIDKICGHPFMFQVFVESMMLRYYLDTFLIWAITVIFLYQMNSFYATFISLRSNIEKLEDTDLIMS